MKNAKSIELWNELEADEERWELDRELEAETVKAKNTGKGLEALDLDSSHFGTPEGGKLILGGFPPAEQGDFGDVAELAGDSEPPSRFLGHCYECGEVVLDGSERIIDHGISRETGYADVVLLCVQCAESRGVRS
jgi:hypothetical protein